MEQFFKYFVWTVFVMIFVYLFASWKGYKWTEKIISIRKSWYFVYVLGALIYWTKYPSTIFVDWLNYLVVFVVFVLVDAFFILNMYFNKLGSSSELTRLTEAVNNSSEYIQDGREKLKNVSSVLMTYQYIEYYETKDEYLMELNSFLQSYGALENINITISEKSTYLFNEIEKFNLKTADRHQLVSTLDNGQVYIGKKIKYVLQPLDFMGLRYVIEMETNDIPDDYDSLILGILISTFDSAMKEL